MYRARGDRFLGHGFHSTSLRNVRIRPQRKANLDKRVSLVFHVAHSRTGHRSSGVIHLDDRKGGVAMEELVEPEVEKLQDSRKADRLGRSVGAPTLAQAHGLVPKTIHLRSCLAMLFPTSHKTPASCGVSETPCDNSFCG